MTGGARSGRSSMLTPCDVAIIDVIWNGFLESIKIAAMAEAYEVNCAPHNYYGHLCSAISAHFCAVVPNFRVMEIDIDSVAWRDELFHQRAGDRERRTDRADRPRLGCRGQRSRGSRPPTSQLNCHCERPSSESTAIAAMD